MATVFAKSASTLPRGAPAGRRWLLLRQGLPCDNSGCAGQGQHPGEAGTRARRLVSSHVLDPSLVTPRPFRRRCHGS